MQDELLRLVTIAVVITPITAGIMQGVKQSNYVSGKLIPLVAIAIAIVLSVLWALSFNHGTDVPVYAYSGIISGLASVGLYNLVQKKEGQ